MAHTGQEFLRDAWRATCGLPPIQDKQPVTLKELRQTEWDARFEQLMRNRLIVGSFRYGRFRDPNKGRFDQVGSIQERLERYRCDGNLEHLVDIANLAMVEFNYPSLAHASFTAIDDGIHANPI